VRAALDAAETLDPSLFWIYMIRPDIELQMGFGDLALASVQRGVEVDPYLLSMRGRLLDVLLWRQDLEGAQRALDELAQLDPDGYWSGRARARLLMAKGDMTEAEAQLLALRERFAGARWIHQELVDFYTLRGDTAAAEAAAARPEVLLRN